MELPQSIMCLYCRDRYMHLISSSMILNYYFFLSAVLLFLFYFFFFSSRRRHTRWTGDWSSDVCSSDLRVLVLRNEFHKCTASYCSVCSQFVVRSTTVERSYPLTKTRIRMYGDCA